MNIFLLNDSFPPTIDGVANVTFNYAKILQEKGDTVTVVTPEYPGVKDDYPFEVVRYPSLPTGESIGYRAGIPFSPELLVSLAQRKPDIIHCHCPAVSSMLARMLRPLADAPIIFTYHTKFDIDIQKAVPGKLLQQTSIRAMVSNIDASDEIWTVSEGAGENMRSLGSAAPYRIMENGVDFPRGTATPEAIAAARKQFDIPTDRPAFLFVGRMMWYKGLKISLDALRIIKDAGLDFAFVAVGDGVDRGEIEAYARQLDLSDMCIFTGAVRNREILRAIFGCADLFLFPSTFDTNGIVVREAAACSCASMLVAGSCAAEGITDRETGFLFDGTPSDMARCIRELCADRGFARTVGQQASQRIYLSWEDAVLRARERYEQVSDAWKTGQLSRDRHAAGDEFFDFTADMLGYLGRTGLKLNTAWETVRELTDEYSADSRERKSAIQQKMLEHAKERVEQEQLIRQQQEQEFAELETTRQQTLERMRRILTEEWDHFVTHTAQKREAAIQAALADYEAALQDCIDHWKARRAARQASPDGLRTQLEKLRNSERFSLSGFWLVQQKRGEQYLHSLKGMVDEQLDSAREDWDVLQQSLREIWRTQLGREDDDPLQLTQNSADGANGASDSLHDNDPPHTDFQA